jgi:tellurite resistance protein TerC
MEALHGNNLPFINNGEPIETIPEIPIQVSLIVIVATLAVTTVVSLVSSRKERRLEATRAIDNA